ncbi:Uncharacterised protein [Klebsiella pneumoniae subsp. ozaenae]|uniref:Uncharacterized protein n=1 Tax=Klebsiella pneumoniae subsp. ozaenae TaxID=574 RepID=A0A378B6I0_KLEPO|nr:Uncharacterised protein [Klebsiella pneumoniae subsp. ozaenae]
MFRPWFRPCAPQPTMTTFFTLKVACAIGEFVARHKAAFAQLCQLLAQVQCIKVVSHVCNSVMLCRAYCSVRFCENELTI